MRSYDQLLVDLHETVEVYDRTGNGGSFARELFNDSAIAIEELLNKVRAYKFMCIIDDEIRALGNRSDGIVVYSDPKEYEERLKKCYSIVRDALDEMKGD